MSREKIGFINRIRTKIHYNSLIGLFLDFGLAKIGISIYPYYVVLEGLFNKSLPYLESRFDEYETCFLSPQDMKTLFSIHGGNLTEEKLLHRLQEGKKCFGVKCRGELVAFTWCDFKECNCRYYQFPLNDNEAYLFDAYTVIPFRGKGLASFIRYQCYKELAKAGRQKLYSVSAYFNTPSIKFKKKLNAKLLELHLAVELFNKWHFNLRLKKYRIDV